MGRKNNELQSAAPMSESVERTKKSKKKQLKNQPAEEEEKTVIINDGANVATDTAEKKKKKRKDREAGLEEDKSNGEDPGSKKKEKKKKNGVVEEKLTKENESIEQKVDHEGIVVSGLNIKESKYAALKSFSEAGLPENVMKCCKDFSKPSPIQSHAWPFLLNGRDFIGIAATGSGKTLAFGIPAMMHCLEKRKGGKKSGNPICLVLSPTRELAQQIADVLCDSGTRTWYPVMAPDPPPSCSL